ncbi:uncharacterized protein MYCFIDRAFT_84651 [Pseudocercospora fijiensis CIRAD86]|uniref:Uncharacterized protein n=1 Tax=Pseudocercospora fijiensis (strain CIRAD86) TaxID=383855 RepID=M2YSC9_PSEFD|nr:uncharacterized protein MYCFIDRAFT_84651 [Pseudocercospora fijiensis CIRAD86]EME80630.1 hypothetical protein MYCFIDRAFT_84651 [Pseudocercospora fijiensis CIRAD86]
MSTTDRLTTLRTSITTAVNSFFSVSFSFVSSRKGIQGQVEPAHEPALPQTPPPKWWQRMSYTPESDISPRMSPHLFKPPPSPEPPRCPAQVQADLRKYTPEGAKCAGDMDLFEDVFQTPEAEFQAGAPFQLSCPPPAPISWRSFIASKVQPPPTPRMEIRKATVATHKRKRVDVLVWNKRGQGNRRGEDDEPARKKARVAAFALHEILHIFTIQRTSDKEVLSKPLRCSIVRRPFVRTKNNEVIPGFAERHKPKALYLNHQQKHLVYSAPYSFALSSTPSAFSEALIAIESVFIPAGSEALCQEHVEATCITCQNKHGFPIEIDIYGNPRPLQWSIRADTSAVPQDLEETHPACQFHGLELSTPTFRTNAIYSTSCGDDGHVHQLDYTGMIKAVLQHAHRVLGTLSSQNAPHHWLYAPAHCRMGVRIGNDGIGFLDSTYERVEHLTRVCARQIDMLHMGQSHTTAPAPANSASSTIDFTQSPSTLDSSQALAWTDVCLSTLRTCADAEHTSFTQDLSSHGRFGSPTFATSDFLQALGTSAASRRFYESLIASTQKKCEEMLATAMGAMASGSKIAELALERANRELKIADSDAVLATIKVKLLAGL